MPSDILAQIEEAKNALPQNQTGLASDIEGVLGRARESAEALSVVKALMSDIANGENLAVAGLERLVAGFGEYDALVARVAANTGALVAENGQLDDTYRQLGQNAPAAFGDANTALERTLSLVGTVTAEVQKMQTALVDATIASALEWIDYEKELARVRNTMAAIGTAAGGIHTPAAPPQVAPPAPVPPPAAPSAPATPAAPAAPAPKAETAEKIEAAETEIADAMKAIVQKIGNFTLSDEQRAVAEENAQSLTGNAAAQEQYLSFVRRGMALADLQETGTGSADLDAALAKITSDFEAVFNRVSNLQGSGADFDKIIARLSAVGHAGTNEGLESALDKLRDVLNAEEEGAKTRRDLAAAIASLKEQTAGDANAELLKQILAQNPVGAMASNREAEARQNAARYSVVATDVNQTAAVRAEAADKAQLEKFIAETLSYYKKGTATPEELREINQALDDFQNATDEDAKEAARQRIDQLTALRENAGHGNEISLGEGIAGKWKEKVADSRDEFNKFAGGNVQGAGRFVAGLAFAGKKLLDFADSVEDAAKSLAENEIAAVNSAAAFDKLVGEDGFNTLRSSLNLTRDQMVEFAGVMQSSGASAMDLIRKNGMSADTVFGAAKRVTAAFGVFKPEAMREVMAILEKMTDSQAKALMGQGGDQEGALANLIANGNAADALALYDQGLLGSQENIPTGAEGEKEMLRNVQSMERALEDIKTAITKHTSGVMGVLIPAASGIGFVSQVLTAVSSGVSTIATLVGAEKTKTILAGITGNAKMLAGSIGGAVGALAVTIAADRVFAKRGQERIERFQDILAVKQAEGIATAQDIANVEAAERAKRWSRLGVWIGGAVGAIVGGLAGVLGGPMGVMAGAIAGAAAGAFLGGFAGEKMAGAPETSEVTEEDRAKIKNQIYSGEGVVSTGKDQLRNSLEQAAATQALTDKLQAMTRMEQNIIDTAGKLNTALANVGGSAAAVEQSRRAMVEAAGSAHKKEMAALQERRSEILKSNLDDRQRRQLLMQVDSQIAESTNKFAEAIKNAADAVTAFMNGLDYQQFSSASEAADALGRRAEMNMDAGAARRAAGLQYTALQGEYEIAKKVLQETIKNGPAELQKKLNDIAKRRAEATEQHRQGKLSDEDYKAKIGALNDEEQEERAGSVLQRSKALQAVAEAELKLKEKIPQIAEREVAVKRQALKFAEDALSIQEDIMTTIGAPAEMLYQLEKDKVRLAYQQLKVEQEKLDSMIAKGASAKDIKEQELEVARKQAAVVKAQYGAQNSILEKMLGALVGSFGEISGLGDINNTAAVLGMGYVDYKNGSYGKGNGEYQGGYRSNLFRMNLAGALSGEPNGEGEAASEEDQKFEELISQNVADIHAILKERLQKIKFPKPPDPTDISPIEQGIANVGESVDALTSVTTDIYNLLAKHFGEKPKTFSDKALDVGDSINKWRKDNPVLSHVVTPPIFSLAWDAGDAILGAQERSQTANARKPIENSYEGEMASVDEWVEMVSKNGVYSREKINEMAERRREHIREKYGRPSNSGAAEGGQIQAPYSTGDKNLIRVNDGEWVLNEDQMEALRKLLGLGSADDVFEVAGGRSASNILGFAQGGRVGPQRGAIASTSGTAVYITGPDYENGERMTTVSGTHTTPARRHYSYGSAGQQMAAADAKLQMQQQEWALAAERRQREEEARLNAPLTEEERAKAVRFQRQELEEEVRAARKAVRELVSGDSRKFDSPEFKELKDKQIEWQRILRAKIEEEQKVAPNAEEPATPIAEAAPPETPPPAAPAEPPPAAEPMAAERPAIRAASAIAGTSATAPLGVFVRVNKSGAQSPMQAGYAPGGSPQAASGVATIPEPAAPANRGTSRPAAPRQAAVPAPAPVAQPAAVPAGAPAGGAQSSTASMIVNAIGLATTKLADRLEKALADATNGAMKVNIEVTCDNDALAAAVKGIVTEPGLARRVVEEGSQSTYTDTGA